MKRWLVFCLTLFTVAQAQVALEVTPAPQLALDVNKNPTGTTTLQLGSAVNNTNQELTLMHKIYSSDDSLIQSGVVTVISETSETEKTKGNLNVLAAHSRASISITLNALNSNVQKTLKENPTAFAALKIEIYASGRDIQAHLAVPQLPPPCVTYNGASLALNGTSFPDYATYRVASVPLVDHCALQNTLLEKDEFNFVNAIEVVRADLKKDTLYYRIKQDDQKQAQSLVLYSHNLLWGWPNNAGTYEGTFPNIVNVGNQPLQVTWQQRVPLIWFLVFLAALYVLTFWLVTKINPDTSRQEMARSAVDLRKQLSRLYKANGNPPPPQLAPVFVWAEKAVLAIETCARYYSTLKWIPSKLFTVCQEVFGDDFRTRRSIDPTAVQQLAASTRNLLDQLPEAITSWESIQAAINQLPTTHVKVNQVMQNVLNMGPNDFRWDHIASSSNKLTDAATLVDYSLHYNPQTFNDLLQAYATLVNSGANSAVMQDLALQIQALRDLMTVLDNILTAPAATAGETLHQTNTRYWTYFVKAREIASIIKAEIQAVSGASETLSISKQVGKTQVSTRYGTVNSPAAGLAAAPPAISLPTEPASPVALRQTQRLYQKEVFSSIISDRVLLWLASFFLLLTGYLTIYLNNPTWGSTWVDWVRTAADLLGVVLTFTVITTAVNRLQTSRKTADLR